MYTCLEPTPKQSRTQKLTALVQWLVHFILMWQSLCKLSDNGLECLPQFFLTQPVMSALELEKADLMLVQFCQTFEQLYGISEVKPNMHLKECVLEYGWI